MKKMKAEEKVYLFLKEQITQGYYPQKMKLNEMDIASQVGVSRSPVRAALTRLAKEGTLKLVPNKGAYVAQAQLSQKEVVERLQVFELLMSQTLLMMEKWRLSFGVFPTNLLKAENKRQVEGILTLIDTLHRYQKNSYLLETMKHICWELLTNHEDGQLATEKKMPQKFVELFQQIFQAVNQKDYASARKYVRLFVNDLSLNIIDQQEIKQQKY